VTPVSDTRAQQSAAVPEQMTLSLRTEPHARVLRVEGEVDMLTSPQLRTAVLDAVTAGPGAVVLDLDGVTFLGTSGLAVLVEARQAAQTEGVALRLACRERRVLRPLTIAGLVPLFDVHETAEDALREM
jgi:anti-sigma B factor antagonist